MKLSIWWQAVRFIEYDSSFSDEEKQQAKALKIACNLNNAACKLKLKDYKQAEILCTKVSLLTSFDHIVVVRDAIFHVLNVLPLEFCIGIGTWQ